ncbi:MAG: heavy metal translocating P-type ATPase metal-binding domain-containing protein, partial [Cytophagales bacterium]|nr:heavy metal translocating P-type ATPase metal-binding domain-containing protein [Cytophagales bacterium]
MKKAAQTKPQNCYHCGSSCDEDHVLFDGKDFCCTGCRTVYEILNESGLDNYYQLEQTPGSTAKKLIEETFAFLDSDKIQQKLVDFQSESLVKVTLYLPAIHCSSCIWLLENLYRLQPGVIQSRVNFIKKKATIEFDPSVISLRQVAELLERIGYPPFISLEEGEKKTTKKGNRGLLLRIGVAGFCFGNIMLGSFPEYFGFEGLTDDFYRHFFSWANVLLSLPVVFYCSTDYFKSAYQGLRERYINIDVPIVLGIVTLFVRSIIEVVFNYGPGYFDSLAGLLFFLLIGKWFQSISYENLSFERDYKSYFPLAVSRTRQGEKDIVPVSELQVGDVIVIRNQEVIPADAELLSKSACINYSFVTGEAEPIEKTKGSYIYAGGRQEGSSIELLVKKSVSQSYLTQLWNQESFQKEESSSREHLINTISRYFTLAVLLIASFTALYWGLVDPDKVMNAFTAVLIVACPCALALASPFALGNAQKIFGRNKLYLKNALVAEKMAKIDQVVFDKTGTLTYTDSAEISVHGDELSEKNKQALLSLVQHSTHPLSRRLYGFLGRKEEVLQVNDFEEIEGKGLKGTVGGVQCRLGNRSFVLNEQTKESINQTEVYWSCGAENGSFRFSNKYRKGLSGLFRKLARRASL